VRSVIRRASRTRDAGRARTDRVVWQAASTLLGYPDEDLIAGLPLVDAAVTGLPARVRDPLAVMAARLGAVPLLEAQEDYVETFDHKRRRTLYLTYWVAGDTRNRGRAILRFAEVYRASGTTPPRDELADHLAVVLEFAATVDPVAGRRLLASHVTPLSMLHSALSEHRSPYAGVVEAVLATLPPPGPADLAEARRLAQAGPPVEAVGLEPYPTGGPR
jgi:nitrate reductase molybdenum cofactor assembly chaperone NarJ/NarW